MQQALKKLGYSVSADGVFGALTQAAVIAFQIAFTHLSVMQALFDTRDLSFETWSRITVVSFSVFILVEIEKWAMRVRIKRK